MASSTEAAAGIAARGARRGVAGVAGGGVPGLSALGGAGSLVKAAAVLAALAGAGTVAAVGTSPATLLATPASGATTPWRVPPGFSSGPSMATYPAPAPNPTTPNPTDGLPASPSTPGSGQPPAVAVPEPSTLAGLTVALLLTAASSVLLRKRKPTCAG